MIRIVLLLLVIAGVAGYFTRPQEPAMQEAANAVLSAPQNLEQGVEGIGASVAGERGFSDYYVATRYVVTLGDETLVNCWGAFTQTMCSRPEAAAS